MNRDQTLRFQLPLETVEVGEMHLAKVGVPFCVGEGQQRLIIFLEIGIEDDVLDAGDLCDFLLEVADLVVVVFLDGGLGLQGEAARGDSLDCGEDPIVLRAHVVPDALVVEQDSVDAFLHVG